MSNKILTTFFASILSATVCFAENAILIEQKDGALAKFVFDSDAEMTYSGNNLVITSETNQVYYHLSDLKKATFHVETSNDDRQAEQVTFLFQRNAITITGARPDALLQIFSLDGRKAGSWRTDKRGDIRIDMDNFKDNIYIITLDKTTYKIAKK